MWNLWKNIAEGNETTEIIMNLWNNIAESRLNTALMLNLWKNIAKSNEAAENAKSVS